MRVGLLDEFFPLVVVGVEKKTKKYAEIKSTYKSSVHAHVYNTDMNNGMDMDTRHGRGHRHGILTGTRTQTNGHDKEHHH
jgi:hypothetical protein